MEEILYWVKTKRAPCLYRYDTANNKCSEPHSSKVKATPNKNNNEQASPKKRKKRKLSIFDDSESEKNEKNIYFENATQPVPQETVLSSCKDSIISENELNIKGTLNLKSSKIRKVDTKKTAPKLNRVSKTNIKRTLRSFGKVQHLDSSLESGLFSGETKNKQSSVSKSVSKKSVEKYVGEKSVPKGGSLKIEKQKPVKGLFDDISDVSGFTANYIRSTKQSSLSNKLNKSKKHNRQLIKESQDNGKRHAELVICAQKSANTSDKGNALNCTDSYNIINFTSKEELRPLNGSIKLDKTISMLKFVEPKCKDKLTLKAGRRMRLNDTSLRSKGSSGSPYFTRSKVGTYDDFFKTDNTSTPIKAISHTKSNAAVLVVDNDPESSDSWNVALGNIQSSKSVRATRNGPLINNNKDKMTPTKVKDKSGFAQCFSESDDELPRKKFFA